MRAYSSYFSEQNILRELCRARVRLASRRHDRLFLHRITSHLRGVSVGNSDLNGLFPGRRLWNRFRPRDRGGMDSTAIYVSTLYRAVTVLRKKDPNASWVMALNAKIQMIQHLALESESVVFRTPDVKPMLKTPGSHEYRALCVFPLVEKIVDSLTARFFRETVDSLLMPSCLAFRCANREKNTKPPTTHDALEKIIRVNRRNRKSGLYVAECDIKGFFDCVSHDVAYDAVQSLCAEARKRCPALEGTDRALKVLVDYLSCYSFERDVKGGATRRLKRTDPSGEFKWPREDLKQLHNAGALEEIGIPQGGALSCFIANAVLHAADLQQRRVSRRIRRAVTYLRYCDDMIILARDQNACMEAFEAYYESLRGLRLPAHDPKEVSSYSSEFWRGKSRAPYHWAALTSAVSIPWVQFLGYQIRHDGMVRVRPSSLKKHRKRMVDATDKLLKALNPGRMAKGAITPLSTGLRKSKAQILFRFQQQLISISVGRRRLGQSLAETMPTCWAHGFRGLKGQRVISSMMSSLDRHRERQVQRVKRRLNLYPDDAFPAREGQSVPSVKYFGHPFSYHGQFFG